MQKTVEKIVVLGTGTMAVGIAAGFIDAGMDVVVLGRSLDKAQTVLAGARQLAQTLAAGAPRPAVDVSAGTINDWND